MQLNPYVAYSKESCLGEVSVLVFASTSKDARRLISRSSVLEIIVDSYIDLRIKRIENRLDVIPLGDAKKIKAGEPHIVEKPTACNSCGLWGCGVNADNTCGFCGEYVGDELAEIFGGL